MRHRKDKTTFSLKGDQRRAMLRTLCINLIEQERIQTTPVKGRVVRRMVEKMVTYGRDNSVHTRRILESKLGSKSAAKKVVDTLAPRFVERKGGYTRMTKLGTRSGDGAKQVIVEFI